MNNSPVRLWRSFLLILGLVALSVVAVEPPGKQEQDLTAGPGRFRLPADGQLTEEDVAQLADDGYAVDEETGELVALGDVPAELVDNGSGSGTTGATGPAGQRGSNAGGQTQTQAQQQAATGGSGPVACKAGQNGGETDTGVKANRIRLAATNVRSGTGASFLGTAYIGMQAVVNRVNSQGGICGRLLELRLVDDGWDAARGAGFIANFAKEDYFALPVVPSSEGLTQAITNGTIRNAAIPVIGSDGMLKEQYGEGWVWPVATATVSTMRIMAKHAHENKAKSFGIVFDDFYKFGIEGAQAFKDYVKQLTGSNPKAFVAVTPGKSSYAGEAQQFNDECGAEGCDFVAMLLTPETAISYIKSQKEEDGRKLGFGNILTGGAQPLFNERFAKACGGACGDMLVWTGYNPPIGRLQSQPDVATYVDDVKSVAPNVDVNNQFLEGAYLGMKVFVHALEKVGPRLTRAAVRDTMNSLTYRSGLASPLTWGPKVPEQRFANLGAQAFKITTGSGGSFVGFSEATGGFRPDPQPGVVPN